MAGMSATHGTTLSGLAHIQQSITDILTTPTGTRIMRREYGSALPYLVDKPLNNATVLQCYAAIALALAQHEPRVRLEAMALHMAANPAGQLRLQLALTRLDTREPEQHTLAINLN